MNDHHTSLCHFRYVFVDDLFFISLPTLLSMAATATHLVAIQHNLTSSSSFCTIRAQWTLSLEDRSSNWSLIVDSVLIRVQELNYNFYCYESGFLPFTGSEGMKLHNQAGVHLTGHVFCRYCTLFTALLYQSIGEFCIVLFLRHYFPVSVF